MITIDPPIEKMSLAEKLELIDRIEATLPDALPSDWVSPPSHFDALREREQRLESGADTLIELEDFIQQVRVERPR